MKAVVSKRNHFDAAAEHVDRAIDSLPNEYKHVNFRNWLQRYTESVVRELAGSFATAAESGIRQAAALICNPEFYETRKKTRERQTKRWKEEQSRQQWEQLQRSTCPTKEQINQEIRQIDESIAYHQSKIVAATKRLEELTKLVPSEPIRESRTLQ